MPSGARYRQTRDGCLSKEDGSWKPAEGRCRFEEHQPGQSCRVAKIGQGPVIRAVAVADNPLAKNLNLYQGDDRMQWNHGAIGPDMAARDHGHDGSDGMPSTFHGEEQMAVADAPYDLDLAFDFELPSPQSPLGVSQPGPDYGCHFLTMAEELELRQIAMPDRRSRAIRSTPAAEVDVPCSPGAAATAPPTITVRNKKRKPTSTSPPSSAGPVDLGHTRRLGHNRIEKRYRMSLNAKIVLLKQCVPSPRILAQGEVTMDDDEAEIGGKRYSKAAILTRSMEYISYLEDCMVRLGRETEALMARVVAFEKLAMSGNTIQMTGMLTVTEKVETLESIKAGFQQTTLDHRKKIPRETKPGRQRTSPRTMHQTANTAGLLIPPWAL